MARRIALIQGHPDPAADHFRRALVESYAKGASEVGHELRSIDVATLDFPLLRTGAHSLKSLERNILRFVGIAPVRGTIVGSIETCGDARRRKWLDGLRALGHKAE